MCAGSRNFWLADSIRTQASFAGGRTHKSRHRTETRSESKEPDKVFLKFISEGMIDLLTKDESKGDLLKFSDFMNNIRKIEIVLSGSKD